MNVKRKVALSCVYESYWDMLPPELQEYILLFKVSQEQIDEARETLMSELRQEIILYKRVQMKWGLGHVQCVVSRTKCKSCGFIHLPHVYGHYKDVASNKLRRLIGHGLSQALVNIQYKDKS